MGGKGSGKTPRDYPPELVDHVRRLYESGQTIREIQQQVTGCRVQTIIARYGIQTRPAVKRDQCGEANHMWRGSNAGYKALHLRVVSLRGQPSCCDWCGTTEGRFEWANLSGDYEDPYDYDRLCVSCHRTYDATRRRATGRRTMPVSAGEVMHHA